MTSWNEIERHVQDRAAQRCEYCRMHQSLQGATFHVEHVIPRSQGGSSDLENLAWACPSCNLHKSNRIEITMDGDSEPTPLFNPRLSNWERHFQWGGYQIVANTSIGSATILALNMNHERRVKIRQAEEVFDLFPPTSDDN